jgi:cytochrome b6-f complex iron-sulfur subunit
MNDRRRFLHVLGATTAAVALPACGGSDSTSGTGTTGAGGGGGGGGGAGGDTSTVTGSTSSSSSSSTASASSSSGGSCVDTVEGVAIGAPSDFATTGLHLLPGTKVLIGRDDKGLYALTSVCTHEFCDMDEKQSGKTIGTINANGIVCGCHGSTFDNYGAVLKGPANKPLKAYALALCEGKLYVDKTTQVPVTTRLDA